MIRIEVQGAAKGGKTTMAAFIYALLGDHGIEATLHGAEADHMRKMAQEDPALLRARALRLAKGQEVVVVERQVKRRR